MTATAATMKHAISIRRETKNAPILILNETMGISIRAGTTISIDGDDFAFDQDTELQTGELKPGTDYAIVLFEEGDWSVTPTLARLFTTVPADGREVPLNTIGGFHFAPGRNAKGIEGGDSIPAINPCSIWDIGFRLHARIRAAWPWSARRQALLSGPTSTSSARTIMRTEPAATAQRLQMDTAAPNRSTERAIRRSLTIRPRSRSAPTMASA